MSFYLETSNGDKLISQCPNYLKKDMAIESDNSANLFFEYLIDSNFSPEKGFISSGNFSFRKMERRFDRGEESYKVLKSFRTNPNLFGFRYSFEDNDFKMSFDSEGALSNEEANYSFQISNEKDFRRHDSEYLNDFDYLFEQYFYPNLETIFQKYIPQEEVINKDTFIDFLNKYNLSDEISVFIRDLVDVYNQSYFQNQDKEGVGFSKTGEPSSAFRFSICTDNEFFKEKIQDRINLFQASVQNKILERTNVIEDKDLNKLNYFLENAKYLENIANEIIFRVDNCDISGRTLEDNKNNRKNAKQRKKICQEFLKEGIISEAERQFIREFEKDNFKGDKSKEEEYKKIISEIEKRYKRALNSLSTSISFIDCISEDSAKRQHDLKGNGFRFLPEGVSIYSYMKELKTNLATFEKQINPTTDSKKNAYQEALDEEVSKYQRSNNLGISGIDFSKIGVIRKIDSLSEFSEKHIRYSQIESLLEHDIPSLTKACYGIQDFSKYTNTFTDIFSEENIRNFLGNEHYHLQSPTDYLIAFRKISEKQVDIPEKDFSSLKEDFLIFSSDFHNQLGNRRISDKVTRLFNDYIKSMSREEFLEFSHNIATNPKLISEQLLENVFNEKNIEDEKLCRTIREKLFRERENGSTILEDILTSKSETISNILEENEGNLNFLKLKVNLDRCSERFEKAMNIEPLEINNIKRHIAEMNKYSEKGISFGFSFEDISDDGKTINLFKILEQYERLQKEASNYSSISPESKTNKDIQIEENISSNLRYIRECILKGPIESVSDMKASEKDIRAFDALTRITDKAEDLKTILSQLQAGKTEIEFIEEERDRKIQEKERISEKIEKLEKEITELENPSRKTTISNFFKSLNKKKKDENKDKTNEEKINENKAEIKKLQKEITELETEIKPKERVDELMRELSTLSLELKLSLEDKTLGIPGILTPEQLKEISEAKEREYSKKEIEISKELDKLSKAIEEIPSVFIDKKEYVYDKDGFESKEAAEKAYKEDVKTWNLDEPKERDFKTIYKSKNEAQKEWKKDLKDWEKENPKPKEIDYTSKVFKTLEEAQNKYEELYKAWEDRKPDKTDYLDRVNKYKSKEEAQAAYDKVVSEYKKQNKDLEIEKKVVILSAIKSGYSKEQLFRCLDGETSEKDDFLGAYISSVFKRDDIETLRSAINDFYDNIGVTPIKTLQSSIDNYFRDNNLNPVDINYSNDLYTKLLKGKQMYSLSISDGSETIKLQDSEVDFFRDFLKSDKAVEIPSELKKKFEDIIDMIKNNNDNVEIKMTPTDAFKDAITKVLESHGDSDFILPVPKVSGFIDTTPQFVSINRSGSDANYFSTILKGFEDTSHLRKIIQDKIKEMDNIEQKFKPFLDFAYGDRDSLTKEKLLSRIEKYDKQNSMGLKNFIEENFKDTDKIKRSELEEKIISSLEEIEKSGIGVDVPIRNNNTITKSTDLIESLKKLPDIDKTKKYEKLNDIIDYLSDDNNRKNGLAHLKLILNKGSDVDSKKRILESLEEISNNLTLKKISNELSEDINELIKQYKSKDNSKSETIARVAEVVEVVEVAKENAKQSSIESESKDKTIKTEKKQEIDERENEGEKKTSHKEISESENKSENNEKNKLLSEEKINKIMERLKTIEEKINDKSIPENKISYTEHSITID